MTAPRKQHDRLFGRPSSRLHRYVSPSTGTHDSVSHRRDSAIDGLRAGGRGRVEHVHWADPTADRAVLTESARYVKIDSLAADAEAVSHRSAPGRGGAREGRRIDVSSGAQIAVSFYAIRTGRYGTEQLHLGKFVLMRGVPLLWIVPNEALADDVLVVVANHDTHPADVHIMDHWRI